MMRLAVVAAMLATLAGCGGGEPESTTSDTVAAETETPAPAAAPVASGALTAEGWEKLRIGMTRAEVEAAYGPDANPGAVGGPETEACDEFRPKNAPDGFLLMLVDGKLARIKLMRDAAVKTDAGLGLGDDADAVKQAYGGEAIVTPHKYVEAPSEYITVWKTGQTGPDYVQDETARGIRYVIGSNGAVESIQAGGPAIQYVEGCL